MELIKIWTITPLLRFLTNEVISIMLNTSDNYTLYDENNVFELALLSVIGDRKEQQDRIGYSLKDTEGIAVICDGMGGHQGGQLASTLAVKNFVDAYDSSSMSDTPQRFLLGVVDSLEECKQVLLYRQ